MARKRKINPAALYFPAQIQQKLALLCEYPMTILRAPAGFGKSTALHNFFDRMNDRSAAVIWHTFVKETEGRGWRTICELLGRIDQKLFRELNLLGIPNQDKEGAILELVENLECERNTFLILDSFEQSGLQNADWILSMLSRHGGDKLHIVVVTRELETKAVFPNHTCYLLTAEDFTFQNEDILGYFMTAGIDISKEQMIQIQKEAGGWILALHMQMMAYVKKGRFSNAGVFQLIQQVIWDELSEEKQDFLLSVSIFSRFTMAQALQLSSLQETMTEQLLHSQMVFIQLDEDTRSYFFHTVFAAFLQDKFELLPKEKKQLLYCKGGDLASQAGDRLNTLNFYYRAGAWDKLFALPLTSYDIADVLDSDTKPMIMDVMTNAPYELKAAHPSSLVSLAFALFFMNETRTLMSLQGEIETIITESNMPIQQRNALLGEMELLMSFLEYNRITDMSRKHKKAMELLGGPASLISVKSTWTFGAPSVLYLYWREAGELYNELEQMDECMPIYYSLSRGHGTGAEYIMRAEAAFLQGDMNNAEILCHRALTAAADKNQNSIVLCGLFLLARLALFRGDEKSLKLHLHSVDEQAKQSAEDLCRYTKDLIYDFISILQGKQDAMSPWLLQGDITERRLVIMTQPFAYIIYGKYLLREKEYMKLLGVCQHMIGISSIFPNMLALLYARIYMAQAHNALGNWEQAQIETRAVMELSLLDKIYMPIAENYAGMEGLLAGIVSVEAKDAFEKIDELGKKLQQSMVSLSLNRPVLSKSERRIYELVKDGQDNKEIAKKLGVQLSTVRNHLSKIYEKAGVSNKVQLILLEL